MNTLSRNNIVNGLLQFNGTDAEKFLQGQLSCDVSSLSDTQAAAGCYCSPQGRIRANFILIKLQDEDYLMLLPEQQISFLMETLAPYVAFFKCDMVNVSDNWNTFGLTLDDKNSDNAIISTLTKSGAETWQLVKTDYLLSVKLPGEPSRWHCISPQPIDSLFDSPSNSSIESTDQDWQTAEMNSGWTWINNENRDKFLPHDLSLPAIGAISFTKGCYTGQEIIARMQYRGTPKYLLATLLTEVTDAEIRDKLVQLLDNSTENKIGQVVNKVYLDDKRWLIVASVKRSLFLDQKNEQKALLRSGERSILCNIKIPESVFNSGE